MGRRAVEGGLLRRGRSDWSSSGDSGSDTQHWDDAALLFDRTVDIAVCCVCVANSGGGI